MNKIVLNQYCAKTVSINYWKRKQECAECFKFYFVKLKLKHKERRDSV